jgi:hypothetical protein
MTRRLLIGLGIMLVVILPVFGLLVCDFRTATGMSGLNIGHRVN